MSKSFGRSEMEGFLGQPSMDDGRTSQMSFAGVQFAQLKPGKTETRFDALSPAETAAYLAQTASSSVSKDKARRYRTNRVLEHHQLAAELLESGHSSKESQPRCRNESDSEGSFGARQQDTVRRSKIAPKEVINAGILSATVQNKARHLYASSSSESEIDEAVTFGHRTQAESSDDEAVPQRQQRRRRMLGSELVIPSSEPRPLTYGSTSVMERRGHCRRNEYPQPATATENTSESSGTSSGDSGSSSSDESSGSDHESSTIDNGPKVVFIPRKTRDLEKSYEHFQAADDKRSRMKAEKSHRRTLESRAMVAREVAVSVPNTDHDHMEESYGASNVIPDDGHASDEEVLVMYREAWELREIKRLLTTLQQEREKESRRLAYERRKQLTDEQVMEEDRQSGCYAQPGRSHLDTGPNTSRYYHRGAYYMDDEEWDDSDIRYKAAEYARAVTGEDKIEKLRLLELVGRKRPGSTKEN